MTGSTDPLFCDRKGITLLTTSEPYRIIWTRHLPNKKFVQLVKHCGLGMILTVGDYLATKPEQVNSWILDKNILDLIYPKVTSYA